MMGNIHVLIIQLFIINAVHSKGSKDSSIYRNCNNSGLVYEIGSFDMCYWITTTKGGYDCGIEECLSMGGYLAYIPDEGAMSVIKVLGHNEGVEDDNGLYIGYRDFANNGTLEISLTKMTQEWAPWASAEPNNNNNQEETCVVINPDHSHDYFWYDVVCTLSFKAVCSLLQLDGGTELVDATANTATTQSQASYITTTLMAVTSATTDRQRTAPDATTSELTTTSKQAPVSSTSMMFTSDSTTSSELTCVCACQQEYTFIADLETKLDNLKSATKVNKSSLSSSRRRLISASDPRTSSTYIGSLGICIIATVCGLMIVLDFYRVINFIKQPFCSV